MTLSALLYGLILVLTVFAGLTGIAGPKSVAIACLVVYLGLEFRRTPGTQKLIGFSLIVAGVALGSWHTSAARVFLDGAGRSLQFLVLFGAVVCLQLPALESPSLRTVGTFVVHQPPGRRFAVLAVAAHMFGAVINLAGLQLVASVVGPERGRELKKRLGSAMIRGFTAAACWSPFYVSIPVVLAALPGLRWLDLAPFGLVLGASMIVIGWTVDRLTRSNRPARVTAPVERLPAPVLLRVGAIFLTLVVPVITFVELVSVPIPIAIGLLGPIYAVLWHGTGTGREEGAPERFGRLRRYVSTHLPNLRGEALLFLGANVFGVGVASAVDPQSAAQTLRGLSLGADAEILLFTVLMTLLGGLGLHPVVLVVVLGQILPPEALGLPAVAMGTIYLGMWAMATTVSPVSATNLYVARLTGESVWSVAWRWNGLYGLVAALLVGGLIVALGHLDAF